jgi:CubicO group peptidase (beta-lactamase class C family)
MYFSRVAPSRPACLALFLLCLPFLSCQEPARDTTPPAAPQALQAVLLEAESPEPIAVAVPEWFTDDSAQQLARELDSVFQVLHRKKSFNGTVLVTKWGQVVYKGAFGYADFRQKDTLSTQTVFQLASVSKQFTAIAIMMLQEEGKLQYDDSLHHLLPGFPYKGITVRQLLTHRSGLSNYTYFSEQLWPDRSLGLTNEDVLRLMAVHQPDPYYQPEVRFDYSNTGYALLASVVEKVAGIPFADFLQQRIFTPLQMRNTFTFGDSLTAPRVQVATGHTGGRRKRSPDFLDSVLGDKGVYSTVEDLHKWEQALYSRQLVKPESLEAAFRGHYPQKKKKGNEDYGFGFRLRTLKNGEPVVYHAGLWHGYTSYLLRNTQDHSSFIILSNLPNGSLKQAIEGVEQVLYPVAPLRMATTEPDAATESTASRQQRQPEGAIPAP